MNSSYKFDFIQSQSYPVIEICIKLVYLIKTQFLHTELYVISINLAIKIRTSDLTSFE